MDIPRFQYHFEPRQGWMNDPNGLVYFRGQYHAFFQHYPHDTQWGPMHWGHAVSDDLIHWEQLPIALYPDQHYEDDGGCFSGSAVVKDGRLYLFYTSVSHDLKQTQSVAFSDDGIHFSKFEGNPVIPQNPLGYPDFRDPKVTKIDGTWYMVVGTGEGKQGKVLLFHSVDLLQWEYAGVLFEGEYGGCIECPDFFKMGEKYVLMFSQIGTVERSTHFVVGDFCGGKLVNYQLYRPEWGPDFYAPQTFTDGNRRIVIGWMYHWGKASPEGCGYAGAFSIPREITLTDVGISMFPVAQAHSLLKSESKYVRKEENRLVLINQTGEELNREIPEDATVHILEDTKSLEIFVNRGESSHSWWLI